MLKKFALWFACFGLSFLVSDVFGWTDQGRAFLYIDLGANVIIVLVLVLILLFAGVVAREKLNIFQFNKKASQIFNEIINY